MMTNSGMIDGKYLKDKIKSVYKTSQYILLLLACVNFVKYQNRKDDLQKWLASIYVLFFFDIFSNIELFLSDYVFI